MPDEMWIVRLIDAKHFQAPVFGSVRDRFDRPAFIWFDSQATAEFAAESYGPNWEAVRVM